MTSSGGVMLSRFLPRRVEAMAAVATGEPDDQVRAFAEWAMERAEGVCWAVWHGGLDEAFAALARDLPDLGRSGVRWSGAGVLQDSGAEWFAFEGAGNAVLVFAMTAAQHLAARQLGVLGALSGHAAYTVAGGATPRLLQRDLRGTRGVPAFELLARSASRVEGGTALAA